MEKNKAMRGIHQVRRSQMVLGSLQFLRGKAHMLLAERFPEKKKRYAWLKRNSPGSVHMSELDREQLKEVISKLEKNEGNRI